ncbi:COG complex component [Wolfiporia cocos MD-104 SS10]|uniref:Conserved oligomeric Golgi complex subunit 2 n=1 Tax=Wolfiporia cocos (strain MD-104) TaxID=742152 RepID=A0A2H3J2Y7_WOLCO|nr:COG complex component [Wolfiporia cocos MD-104 SS10]
MAVADESRDRFQLHRLAVELATRELTSPTREGEIELDVAERNLPVYVPLAHDNHFLSAQEFNVEEFLLSRAYTSLPDLRTELRDYLATLKEELVRLINDDYEAFISLSTDLRGEGERLENLQKPLGDLKSQVLEARRSLQLMQDAIEAKLNRRSALREQKAFLHLLLKISESVTRLESLLLIASPDDEDNGISEMQMIPRPDEADDRTRGNRAKHLARVAAEYTQLLYHASRAPNSAFVNESQWRIDRIKSTLSSDLDHLFATTIKSLVSGKEQGKENRATDAERTKWLADVTECFRTYDVLYLWRDAEELLRRELVSDFVKKTIHPGALASPHSPILPHTPFPPRARSPALPLTASYPPRTPYTPFTAFASKQNPFEFSLQAQANAPLAHILDDRDDALAALYNTVLRFVDRDLRRIMEAAERVCVKSGSRTQQGDAGSEHGFEIMANVVWAEIGRAIMDELGGIVFAAGRPDDFRKHHETTQAFVRSLEFLAPSVHSVEVMRAHPTFAAFERRWQLPVYFQLRWKEIVTKLEESLSTTRLERVSGKSVTPFVTFQAAAVWEAIGTCWSAQVYIPELNHRFWKFTLQLLSRYKTWLDSSLPPFEPPPKVAAAVAAEKLGSATGSPASLSRAGTPNPPAEAASAEAVAADETLLLQFSTAIIDINVLEAETWRLWREELSMMLPEPRADDDAKPEDALKQSLSSVTALVPPLSGQIIAILSRRACDALLSMRSIPSQFRAMSSNRMPTEASYFVSLIFRPVKSFFGIDPADGPGSVMKKEFLQAYAEGVFEIVAQRYIYYLSAMKKTEESLRRLKKGKKSTFSLFGSSAKDDDGRADEEKIRMQMVLDVEAFGKDAVSLGVDVHKSDTYKQLQDMAGASSPDNE